MMSRSRGRRRGNTKLPPRPPRGYRGRYRGANNEILSHLSPNYRYTSPSFSDVPEATSSHRATEDEEVESEEEEVEIEEEELERHEEEVERVREERDGEMDGEEIDGDTQSKAEKVCGSRFIFNCIFSFLFSMLPSFASRYIILTNCLLFVNAGD